MTTVTVLRYLNLLGSFFNTIFAPEYFAALSSLVSIYTH